MRAGSSKFVSYEFIKMVACFLASGVSSPRLVVVCSWNFLLSLAVYIETTIALLYLTDWTGTCCHLIVQEVVRVVY